MKNLKEQISIFKAEFTQQLDQATTAQQFEKIRISFLGRKGRITLLMAQMKTLPVEQKRELGPLLNKLKQTSEQQFNKIQQQLVHAQRQQVAGKQKYFDVSAYKPGMLTGSLHIYTQIIERVENIFMSMGYDIADGPEAETDYYNFQALNVPQDHPARDMQDTFWLNVPDMLMRTQTSDIQIHQMEKMGAPIALIAPGRVYRKEATDASHDFMFSQVEGLFVDKNVSMSHLLATVQTFLQELFEQKELTIRVRPGYFPFVEPGLEVDFSCPFCTQGCSICKKTKWIELMGAGLVHPNVLKHGGIDPEKYSGFAFGFGLERLAMLKHGINDIRLFHRSSLSFLKQF